MELLWRSHLPPATWWECEVVNSPAVPLAGGSWGRLFLHLSGLSASLLSTSLTPQHGAWTPATAPGSLKVIQTNQKYSVFISFLLSIKRRLSRRRTGVGGVSVPYGCVFLMKKKNKLDGLVCRLLLNWSRYLISPENWKINFQHRPDRGSVVSWL